MNKLIQENEVSKTSAHEKFQNKKVVLTGGVFDILHEGHISFLKKAKEYGDILFVLLESDENVKRLKGENRPINDQKTRAKILSSLEFIDYVVLLGGVTNNEEYDKLIVQIKPDVIALTFGDPQIEKRKRQCEMVGSILIEIEKTDTASTTDLIKENG